MLYILMCSPVILCYRNVWLQSGLFWCWTQKVLCHKASSRTTPKSVKPYTLKFIIALYLGFVSSKTHLISDLRALLYSPTLKPETKPPQRLIKCRKVPHIFLPSITIQCLTASATEGEGIERRADREGAESFRPVADKRTGSMGEVPACAPCPQPDKQ